VEQNSEFREKKEYIDQKKQFQNMENYKNFRGIKEVRRPKKCPVLNFAPIRESDVFKDMMEMGFVEALPDKPAGIQTEGPSEERHFKDRLGNIAFYHPELARGSRKQGYPQYNIKHDGNVRVVQGPSKSTEYPRLSMDLRRVCMTVEDYLFKMGFLVKLLLQKQGFRISEEDLYGMKSYKDVISEGLKINPSLAQKITIPSSLKRTDDVAKGSSILKRFGAFGDE